MTTDTPQGSPDDVLRIKRSDLTTILYMARKYADTEGDVVFGHELLDTVSASIATT